MAYPPILVDQDGNPIPQRWDSANSKWEAFDGRILGPDGQPISSSNPLHVEATKLQDRVGQLADAAVADPSAPASMIAALKGILADLGQLSDAAVDAGAAGSMSAKLRRLTQDVGELIRRIGDRVEEPEQYSLASRIKAIEDIVKEIYDDQAGALKTQLTGNTELKKASIGAHVSHRWARTARGVNLDFSTTGSPPLTPLEQVVTLDIAGPGRLIMGRFVTNNLRREANIIIEVDGRAVSGQAAQWLTGFFSLMDESRLNLSAGQTHGPWEIVTRESDKYALGLDGAKVGPWSTSLKITLENTSTSDPISIGSLIWYAVMSSQAMSLHGTGTRVASREIRNMLAQQWPNTDEYSVVTLDKEEGDGWECEVFWRNGVDEQDLRAFLHQAFGLVQPDYETML